MAGRPARKAPTGLKRRGAALWRSMTTAFDLEQHELTTLREVCRTVDAIDALQAVVDRDGVMNESAQGVRAHPALVELRQQRLALTKLVAALAIPADALPAPVKRYGIQGAVS
ncbi:terminase [Rhodococcus sp. EPR-157]|uniref:terminase n=1 Tax=Rhodococcus sp. EPR-157 TaxID=1813677 RepID=UPI0007BB9416|nr:terminase [Rhodococcus sp. EPR-157]KZF00879.1 terminase [Rhodococcus sp. EPR-157]